jgi:hypothetical protein
MMGRRVSTIFSFALFILNCKFFMPDLLMEQVNFMVKNVSFQHRMAEPEFINGGL